MEAESMKKGLAIAAALMVCAIQAAAASARVQVPSGDTCAFSGTANQYTVSVKVAAGSQQSGLAFGAPGLTISNISISGNNGTMSTSGLPPNTTAAWTSDAALTGTVAATLTVSGTATGPFIVVPSDASQQGSFMDAVTCSSAVPVTKAVPIAVSSRATYSAKVKAWRLLVIVPSKGHISAAQPHAPNTALRIFQPVVEVRDFATKSGGHFALTLRPTPHGSALLRAKGSVTINLRVTFNAANGRTAHQTVTLTLRK